MQANHTEEFVAQDSGPKQVPTLPALRHLFKPIASSGLRTTGPAADRATAALPDAAFVLLVVLAPTAESEISVDGKRDALPAAAPTDTFVLDMAAQPVANLDADLSIADLAGECRLSPSHFARAFARSVGAPPHKWLINRRIERAKELLRGGGHQLAQIALSCGFVDQSHFTRVFTRCVGQSPGRWRRQHCH